MTLSGCWVGGSYEERDREAGVPKGSGVSDDGGSGDCDPECRDRKPPLRECISSQGFGTLRLGEDEMIW